MITRIAASVLAFALWSACETTTTSTKRSAHGRYESNNSVSSAAEPAPPAEGPEDIPAEGPLDVNRNPALVPSPLLRDNAAADP